MSKTDPPFPNPQVANAFAAFPDDIRDNLLGLRRLIFDVAAQTPAAGQIEETLKWGQPAYLTPHTKSGSTIRLAASKKGGFGLFTHCQTTLMSDFREQFPSDFAYDGNRAVLFSGADDVDPDKVRLLIGRALTYHL